ncbi:MAG TPA: Uma2 family endonuclease [Chloroflexota bacterium]|jgi:Uma2 family endonuclease|nr:Uma2 family endonuclease [Chloroflexota bacterium]
MATTQRLTLAEFLALPEEEPALELEPDGVVVQKVSPKGRHSRLQLVLCERINQFAEPRHVAMAFPELRVAFGGAAYVPDVSVFGWERIPRTPDGEIADMFEEPPEAAIEIVSPQPSVNAVLRRCVWYVEHGVGLALVVDPADRSVVQFVRGQAPHALRGEDRIDFEPALRGFAMTVDELFGSLRLDA